jgi:hypothetical protein
VPLSDWHITSTSLAVTFVIQAAAITAALLVLRWAGFALADDPSEVRPQDAGPLSFQFSLQSLLGVVAAVAFCLATSSMVVRYTFLLELPEAFLLPMGTRGVGHAVLGLAAAWAVLGTRRAALRTSALGLAVLAAVALQAVTARTALRVGGMSRGWHELALATLAELVFVLIGMGAIRLSGLRLVRTSPAR